MAEKRRKITASILSQTTLHIVDSSMESSVKLGKNSGVTIFVLDHGSANAIDDELLNILVTRLQKLDKHAPLLLTGSGKFFSAGLDLHYCETLSKSKFEGFIEKFQDVLWSLVTRPGPTSALLNGHAVAGGFLMAAGTDRVLMRPGQYAVGLVEARMGFSLPAVPAAILRNTFPEVFKHIRGRHEYYTPEQMAAFSPFEICTETNLTGICRGMNNLMGNKEWRYRKRERQKAILTDLQKTRADVMERFYAEWWSKKAVSARSEVIRRWKKRSGEAPN